jgi:Domain of unknown function (DUF4167)
MRPQKRSRGRNGGGNPYHNNGQNRGGGGGGGPRPPHRSQTYDSNGPSVKIRGNAYQVFERYLALAREAQSSGDRIAAENFYQHAEHYFRMMNANGEAFQRQQQQQQMQPEGEPMDGEGEQPEEAHFVQIQPAPPPPAPPPPPVADEDELPPFITGRAD